MRETKAQILHDLWFLKRATRLHICGFRDIYERNNSKRANIIYHFRDLQKKGYIKESDLLYFLIERTRMQYFEVTEKGRKFLGEEKRPMDFDIQNPSIPHQQGVQATTAKLYTGNRERISDIHYDYDIYRTINGVKKKKKIDACIEIDGKYLLLEHEQSKNYAELRKDIINKAKFIDWKSLPRGSFLCYVINTTRDAKRSNLRELDPGYMYQERFEKEKKTREVLNDLLNEPELKKLPSWMLKFAVLADLEHFNDAIWKTVNTKQTFKI